MKIDFKNKKTLYTIGGLVVIVILFWLFMRGGGDSDVDSALTEVASDPVELIIGREMLSALDQMKSVKLDNKFFDSKAYSSLRDFTVEIPKQPIGRRDPFAEI